MIKLNSPNDKSKTYIFDRIAEDYFKKDLVSSSSIARQLRLYQTLKAVSLKSSPKILEVGCGGGFSAKYLSGNYAEYLGLDRSEKLINFAKNQFEVPSVSYRALDIEDLEPDYKNFDLIFMIGVLHHIDEIQQVLRKLKSHLRPGGALIVNEPKPGNPIISLLRSIRKKIDNSYSEDQKELSIRELMNSFNNAGYTNVHFYPQGIFSTPFAEIPFQPTLMLYLSQLACKFDYFIEHFFSRYILKVTWNIVFVGFKPIY